MKTSHKTSAASAEKIARQADRGEDVTRHFTNRGRMMPPAIQRVNVDFTAPMLAELDQAAQDLNISRQAVIKTFLRHALDQRHLAAAATPGAKRQA